MQVLRKQCRGGTRRRRSPGSLPGPARQPLPLPDRAGSRSIPGTPRAPRRRARPSAGRAPRSPGRGPAVRPGCARAPRGRPTRAARGRPSRGRSVDRSPRAGDPHLSRPPGAGGRLRGWFLPLQGEPASAASSALAPACAACRTHAADAPRVIDQPLKPLEGKSLRRWWMNPSPAAESRCLHRAFARPPTGRAAPGWPAARWSWRRSACSPGRPAGS